MMLRDTLLRAEILDAVRARACTTGDLVRRTGATQRDVYRVVTGLAADGAITRTGRTRTGAVWCIPSPTSDEVRAFVAEHPDSRTRDVAERFGVPVRRAWELLVECPGLVRERRGRAGFAWRVRGAA